MKVPTDFHTAKKCLSIRPGLLAKSKLAVSADRAAAVRNHELADHLSASFVANASRLNVDTTLRASPPSDWPHRKQGKHMRIPLTQDNSPRKIRIFPKAEKKSMESILGYVNPPIYEEKNNMRKSTICKPFSIINAHRLVTNCRPGNIKKKLATAVRPPRIGFKSSLSMRTRNRPNRTRTNPFQPSVLDRIVKKQGPEASFIEIHERHRMRAQFPIARSGTAGSGTEMIPIVPVPMNDHRAPSNIMMKQRVSTKGGNDVGPLGSDYDQGFDRTLLFQESGLHYRRMRMNRHQIPGRENPVGLKNEPSMDASGSGGNPGKYRSAPGHRIGETASDPPWLSERQKEAVREYLNNLSRQEMSLVADRVYDIIERRLTIEQERRGWT